VLRLFDRSWLFRTDQRRFCPGWTAYKPIAERMFLSGLANLTSGNYPSNPSVFSNIDCNIPPNFGLASKDVSIGLVVFSECVLHGHAHVAR
jgi:hypothetical protein